MIVVAVTELIKLEIIAFCQKTAGSPAFKCYAAGVSNSSGLMSCMNGTGLA